MVWQSRGILMGGLLNKVRRKLTRVVYRTHKLINPRALILLYHSIGDEVIDPFSVRVSPKNFEEHLQVLKKFTKPISLSKLAESHRNGSIPHKSVAVTFDDGYANNLYSAKPLLDKLEIPGTVFVASGFVKEGQPYFWDELAHILLQPGTLPPELNLVIGDDEHHWELGTAAGYTEEEAARDPVVRPWQAQRGTRLEFFYSVWYVIHIAHPSLHQVAVRDLQCWAGGEPFRLSPAYRAMTSAELAEIEEGGLVEIGGHTVNHPQLSFQSPGVQAREIRQNKNDLEEYLNHPVTGFAYPYGGFTPETAAIVKDAGFFFSCTTHQESVWRKSGSFAFPRWEVTDFSGEELEKRLSHWFSR